MTHEKKPTRIVYIDSSCPICTRLARFIIKKERRNNTFYFADANESGLTDFIALEKENQIWIKSAAILEILKDLQFPFNVIGYAGQFIPEKFRDLLYMKIAKNRHRFLSQKECSMKWKERQVNEKKEKI
jgi:predicted DCC family thiol-disulfide oxidoreductase YuxK